MTKDEILFSISERNKQVKQIDSPLSMRAGWENLLKGTRIWKMQKWEEFYPIAAICVLLCCAAFIVAAVIALFGGCHPDDEKTWLAVLCVCTWVASSIGLYDMFQAIKIRRETRKMINKAIADGLQW